MPTVTAIEKKGRGRRLELQIDGLPGLSVTPDVAVQFGLRAGSTLTESRLEQLRAAQEREDAMAAALRLVSYRPRSEKELRDRLAKRYKDASLVDGVVSRLKELRLVDDSAFAASWVDNRDRNVPRSGRVLAAELRLKGVARETAATAVETIDEGDAAYRAASKKAAVLGGKPFEEFRRKVGDLLLRRGFSYETASETVRQLWEESGGRDGAASDEPR